MRLFISLSAALLLAALILTACNSSDGSGTKSTAQQPPPQPNTQPQKSYSPVPIVTPGDGVRRVTTTELHDALDKGTAIVIDVRGDDQYKQAHVKGAMHIPEAEVASRSNELPRDKMIVTYCS
jgi:predicted small secreted protein